MVIILVHHCFYVGQNETDNQVLFGMYASLMYTSLTSVQEGRRMEINGTILACYLRYLSHYLYVGYSVCVCVRARVCVCVWGGGGGGGAE